MAPKNIDIDVIVHEKEETGEYYIFLYTARTRREVVRCFGRFASNPELSFTWIDAARASKMVRDAT